MFNLIAKNRIVTF